MSPKAVRIAAMAVFFAIGIPGMIVTSINGNAGAAVTFGLLTVPFVLVLLAVTAVTTGRLPPTEMSAPPAGGPAPGSTLDEEEAEALEARVHALVARGADEQEVRDLVRSALRMARSASR
jgi:hypothetical protein